MALAAGARSIDLGFEWWACERRLLKEMAGYSSVCYSIDDRTEMGVPVPESTARTTIERRHIAQPRSLAHARRVLMASVSIVWIVSFVGCGLNGEDRSTEVVADPSGGESIEETRNGPADFSEVLEKVHAVRRDAVGREGILAEERLYSNFDEELIIRDFFQDRKGLFYVDVGCARPVKGSNTYYLEKHLGWTGIGIDALEDYAEAWKEMRPNAKFLRHLVSNKSGGTEKFFRSYGRGISSTNREWASGKAFGEEFPTEEIPIETITLNDLLDREGVTKIDLVSIDIEGHESKALAGFDIERFQPGLVVIERQINKPKMQAIYNYFINHGYERIERYRAFDTVNDYYRPKVESGGS